MLRNENVKQLALLVMLSISECYKIFFSGAVKRKPCQHDKPDRQKNAQIVRQKSRSSAVKQLITGLYHRQKYRLRRIKNQHTDILRHQIDHRKGIKVDQKDCCALSA